jgi:hypothetical protein
MRLHLFRRIAFCFVLLLAPSAAWAADVLQEVPNDVLGFVVAHHLNTVDAKSKWLSLELRNNAFSPLTFLKTVTNIQDGLNLDGDFLLAAYPDPHGDKSRMRFGIWLPVSDYARFAKSIGASAVDGISTVTVAGEDLLVARRGEWALVMDTDQRDRLTQLVAAATPAAVLPQLEGWRKWINGNDVTVIANATGVRELLSWADDSDEDAKADNDSAEDVFGAANPPGRQRAVATAKGNHNAPQGIAGILSEYRKWTSASPAIAHTIEQANMLGCGLRINMEGTKSGSAILGVRVAFNDGFETEAVNTKTVVPNSIYGDGGFAFAGAGQLPKSVMETIACGYLRTLAADMKKEEHTELDEDSLTQLNEAVEQAAGGIQSAMVLAQPGGNAPGGKLPPVYTNNWTVVRVASSADFVRRTAEVMRLWNKANRDADGEMKLILDEEDAKIGEREAKQYSIDFVAMYGTPAVPEIRQSMEKLFGPGGKFRIWIVPVDERTVLVGVGLQEQVAERLKLLDRKQPIDWNQGELAKCNQLLPADANWRVFFDPHRYNDWARREAMAGMTVPVIGGPLVKPLRDCPPVGMAGGFRDQELWVDVAVLTPTLKSVYDFLAVSARRPEVRLRVQPAPR